MLSTQKDYSDEHLLLLLKTDKSKAIQLIFKKYYSFLCNASFRIVQEEDAAKDIVQEVFVKIWENNSGLNIKNLKPYIQKSVVNASLNYLEKHKKVKFTDIENLPEIADMHYKEGISNLQDLEEDISQAIASLPPACRVVFCLSRYEEYSNSEIATHLNISIKAVEKQITKALKILRVFLKMHLNC